MSSHSAKGTRPGKALDLSADAKAHRFVRQSRTETPPTPAQSNPNLAGRWINPFALGAQAVEQKGRWLELAARAVGLKGRGVELGA